MTKKSNRGRLWFLGAFLLWLASYFVIRFIFKLENGDAGTFGDQFGAINALFTGLSFAGIIITLRLQQEELSAQRREFMTSRAMTIVYKQIELVSSVINNAHYIPESVQGIGLDSKNFEINGIFAIKRWNDLILKSQVKKVQELRLGIFNIVNNISNSITLLVKIKNNENMSDDDALFVFESFKYNIDHRVWTFIETLKKVKWDDADINLEDLKNDVYNISSFLDEMKSLKNNTNSSK